MDSIRTSIELGLAGEIDAVTTAPINKVAIKMGGVKQAGHTEIYMDGTKAPYVLTMFDCFKMRVFHLSRHISLMNAIRYATKEHVLNDICRIDKELKGLGMETPYIAVAGINPHSGEGGLFGDEEVKEIIPAIEEARKRGINAIGPVPPDTLFSRGKMGNLMLYWQCIMTRAICHVRHWIWRGQFRLHWDFRFTLLRGPWNCI